MTSTELDTKKQIITTAVSKRTLVSVPMTVTQTAPPKKTSRIRKAAPSASTTPAARKRPIVELTAQKVLVVLRRIENLNYPEVAHKTKNTIGQILRFPRFFVFQEAGFMLPVSLSVE